MIDLADFDIERAETGEVMEVMFPGSNPPVPLAAAGEEPPITLTLRGTDSGAYRAVRRDLVKRRQQASARNGGTVPLEVIEAESLETVLACLICWDGIIMDGAPVDFTSTNARRVLTRLPWLVEQAEVFIHNRANFLKRLPNGSSA
jgi:hypothetical protein